MLLLSVLFVQCTKIDITSVGSGLIPGVDNIHTFDTTFNITANNFDDVTACDSIGPGDLLASGIITNEPLFGSAKGEMYFNFKPSSFPVNLPTHDTLSMEVDSVVLVLKYSHSFGDTNTVQKLKVYNLLLGLKRDSIYKTCNRMAYDPDLVGEATFIPARLRDSIHVFKEDDANQLRIKLDNSLGVQFIKNQKDLTSDSVFNLMFRGLAVVPDEATGGNALNYFNLSSQSSRISIYTRSVRDTIKDTSIINLSLTSLSSQANYVEKDRGASEITQHLSNNPAGDEILYIQSYPGGSYAKLNIPGLENFPNNVVNRAELIVQQEYDPAADNFAPPRFLFLDIKDTSGDYIPIPCDFTITQLQAGFPNLGGVARKVTDNNGKQVVRYTFNITRYVQSILTKSEENAEIRLRAPFYVESLKSYVDRCGQLVNPFSYPVNTVSDGEVKLSGTNGSSSAIRLHLIYSKL